MGKNYYQNQTILTRTKGMHYRWYVICAHVFIYFLTIWAIIIIQGYGLMEIQGLSTKFNST